MFYEKYNVDRDVIADANYLSDQARARRVYDETMTTLSDLKKHYSIYVGSNTDNDILNSVMNRNGVEVDKIYTSQDLQCYKPSATFYKRILNDNVLLCDEVLFVGDSITDDVCGPKQVGIKTCWLNRNGKITTDIVPDYEIKSLTELLYVLKT